MAKSTTKQKKTKILFCLNDRGANKRSCAASSADELRRYAKKIVGNEQIKIKKTGCLGLCKRGPVIQILPSKIYYQCTTEADIDLLLLQANTDVKTGKASKKNKLSQASKEREIAGEGCNNDIAVSLRIRTGKAAKN